MRSFTWSGTLSSRPMVPVEQRGSLRLLPSYDCYVLGCGPREWVVPQAARTRVSTDGRGRFEGATALPVLLIDGVAGMWEQRKLTSRSELLAEVCAILLRVGNWRRDTQCEGKERYAQTIAVRAHLVRRFSAV